MYFKKLEIFGFKSFADKTVLNLEPGITAVVGPNGCGKSNVFDSIRWVLGEQSVKELRGASMEDVIFNGTQSKPALGFAEVSLTFSNEARMLDIEYDEVTVTRRLFRSGESEYLLNKTKVRLKDIQELLMGTGMGTQAYSMVQQGKVDRVVSAKPEERRAIFDEASGITKYKAKKREALNKLKDTENNLLRINDIVIEVKRQIASIERQANKARKYKVEYERLQGLEVRYAKTQLMTFTDRKSEIEAKLSSIRQRKQEIEQKINALSDQLTNQLNYLDEVEQKINAVRSEEIKLEGQIDINNKQIVFNQERIENIETNASKISEQKEQLKSRCAQQQEKIEDVKESVRIVEQMLVAGENQLNEKRETLIGLQKAIDEAKNKIKSDEEKILNLTSKQVSIRNVLTDVMKDMQGALARKRRLEFENTKVSSERQEVEEKLSSIQGQISSIRESIDLVSEEKRKQKALFSQQLNVRRRLEATIQEQEKRKMFLISQKDFIEKMHAQYEDMPDPVVEGRLLTQMAPEEHHTGIIGKVKSVKLASGGSIFQSLKDKFGNAEAGQLYEIICETKFIELDPQQISTRISEISSQVEFLISRRDNVDVMLKNQENICERLENEIQAKEKAFSVLSAQKQDILSEEKKLDGELELIDGELIEVKEQLVQIKKKEDEQNYELDTINQEINWCQNDIKDKQTDISNKQHVREGVTVNIAQLETEMQSNRDKLKSQQSNYSMFVETLDGWLEEIKKIDDEVVQQLEKKEKYVLENQQLDAVVGQLKEKKGSLDGVLQGHESEKQEASQMVHSVRAEVRSLENEDESLQQEVHDIQMNEQELTFNVKGIKDRLIQSYSIDIDSYQEPEEVSEEVVAEEGVSAESAEVSVNEGETSEQVSNENAGIQEAAEELLAAIPLPATRAVKQKAEEVPMTIEEMEAEIEKLQKRCKGFGSVNLVAIEEYEELKKRFEFLTSQQADLLEAKAQLMSTIGKINRSTRQLFMDTFTKVSEEFRIYFRMLFGGGEAQLILQDPDNVLESGIDIIARPPGKKLQNISLLSGGEKTLTAIAMIFGVFKVNPSPFCVLDEIDAALDESNVGRFSYLLKEFSKIAQFVVITHNKKTISCADVMYGVTMPETGVSKLVSVKFAENDKKVEEKKEVAAAV